MTGKVIDTNTNVLAKLLFERGVTLSRVEVVRDKTDDIVESIHRLRSKCDYIFTSGGIGPTHDDITYEAIAKAFDTKLVYHQPTVDKMREYYASKNQDLNKQRLRMALIPERSKVLNVEGLWVPLVVVDDMCYVLPGVPQLYSKLLDGARDKLPSGNVLKRRVVRTNLGEGTIAEALERIQKEHPSVAIGSYPQWLPNNDISVRVTLECYDQQLVDRVAALVAREIEGFEEGSAGEESPRSGARTPHAPSVH